MWKFTEQPEAKRVIRWKVSKDGETGKKKIGNKEEHCCER